MKVSYIIPVYNNSDTLATLANQLHHVSIQEQWAYEIIFVDDCSKDDSLAVSKKLEHNCSVIHLHKNKGQSTAVLMGMTRAKGDVWIVMDADLQDDPAFVPTLVHGLLNNKKDVCFSGRSGKYEGKSKLISAKGFKYVLHWLSGKRLPADACMFFAITKDAGQKLLPYSGSMPYLLSVIAREKLNCISIYYQRKANPYGKSNYTFRKRWKVAKKGIMNFFFLEKRLLPTTEYDITKNAS